MRLFRSNMGQKNKQSAF